MAFGASTTASEVASIFSDSIKDRVFLITGVNPNGIGGAIAKALAPHSPHLLILTGRSREKVQAVINDISTAHPQVTCRFLQLDLSSSESIRKAAETVLEYAEPLHVLINNAGVMAIPTRTLSSEGVEMQFQTNFLGPFLLTNLLLPKLLNSTSSNNSNRIINVASNAHIFSPVRFSDLTFTKTLEAIPEEERYDVSALEKLSLLVEDGEYVPWAAYAQSKTAVILFTKALQTRLKDKNVECFTLHPGSIETDLQRHADQEALAQARSNAGSMIVKKTLEQGAATVLLPALDPQLVFHGQDEDKVYMVDCVFVDPAVWCNGERGKTDAEKLWKLGETMTGLS